ncbi:MAG TPA: restriction endonuclease subunit S [Gammaproteobacteria bacterium]|nr:restriction endonuclease subunit S [Gammaproteobacteria bacterium]
MNVGCIFYALYGATSGEVGLSKINGAINQAILAITPHNEISSGFVMQWLRKNKAQIISTYMQSEQNNLSGTIVKNFVVDLPHYEEQTKIGNLFKQLDTLINQYQAQLKNSITSSKLT